jgi:aspartyl-tRNA(Asn)/glutamyl-tRNA(Gln) amidotransferase subunit A
MCPVALGSDGGGSIRIPAALCGVLGMKPTFGLVPLHPGCRDSSFPGFSAWETLEHIGPMARTAADLALLLGVIVGLDTRDRHSVPSPFAGFTLRSDVVAGLRVGVCFDLGGDGGVSDEARDGVLRCVDVLGRAGAIVESVTADLPPLGEPFGAIAALEADLAGLRDLVAAHPDGLNARILRMLDRDWSFDEVADAVRVRKDVSNALNGLLRQVDVLVTPCVPTGSVPLDPGAAGAGPSDAADPQRLSGFTMPFNFTGHPALSLPVAVAGQPRPVGVQLVADRFRDDLLLSVASVVLAELDADTEVRAS